MGQWLSSFSTMTHCMENIVAQKLAYTHIYITERKVSQNCCPHCI